MKISAIYLASHSRKVSGFSLIEITVVLVLLSLLSLVVLPRMGSLYASFKNKSQIDQIVSTAQSASLFAYTRGQPVTLVEFLNIEKVVPEGWEVRAESPISVKSNGVCLGGKLEIQTAKTVLRYQALPPFCKMELIGDA